MSIIQISMKGILPFLLMALLSGCGTSIKSLSDIKWSGNDTGISKKIDNMGYYKISDKSPEAFVFYDDGTVVLCGGIPEDTTNYGGGYFPPGCMFDKDINRWDGGGTTGLYRIEGDTIYANMYFRNCFYLSWRFRIYFETWMYKMKFLILDRTRILWIDEHLMDKDYPNPEMINYTLIFHKAKQLPPPNTDMKKRRWLWEHKN